MAHFIIDCDPGHDDAVAIVMAARHLDVVGITTVYGNSTVENTTRNAMAILDAAGLEHIPVAMGAGEPIKGSLHSGAGIHGKTGLDGGNFTASVREPDVRAAADFINDMSKEYNDLVVIGIAPETNLAVALTTFPELASRIAGFSLMGGSTHIGNATAAAEFNIFADPEAAEIVFRSGVPITLAGLNVTTTFGVSERQVAELRAARSHLTRELGGALSFYLSRQRAFYDRPYAPLHDVCAVIPFSHPGLINHVPMHVAVECQGQHTRGMTVCDQRGVIASQGIAAPEPVNARVAISARGNAIVGHVLDTLKEFS